MDGIVGSMIMGILGNLTNVASTVSTNKAMLRNAAEARAFSKRMADMQNAYNSPSAQVARLVSAGLNPHQAFGGSVAPAATVGDVSPPSMQAPQVDFSSLMNAYLGTSLQLEMQKKELDYKYAALREDARQFDITEGLTDAGGATSSAKDAQTALLLQQKQFNDADRAVQVATSEEYLRSLKLDNDYKEKKNELELNYMDWRNTFEKQMGSYRLTEAKYKNLILGNQKRMSDVDAKLYKVISDYKAELLKAGVDKARLDNILLETDKVKRESEISKLKTDIALQEQLYESRDVQVPWLDYTLDVLGSVVSMVTSFIPFAGGQVKGSTYNKSSTISYELH